MIYESSSSASVQSLGTDDGLREVKDSLDGGADCKQA